MALKNSKIQILHITIIKVDYPVNTTIYFAYQRKNYPPSTPNYFCYIFHALTSDNSIQPGYLYYYDYNVYNTTLHGGES